MTIALRLLGEVSWCGEPIAGQRPARLLAALVLHPSGLSGAGLADEVWGAQPPAVPGKALQVLVSRLRAQCGAGLIESYDGGYRLGLQGDEVDMWRLTSLADLARAALAKGDPRRVMALADEATLLVCAGAGAAAAGDGPLVEIRTRASATGLRLQRDHGLSLSRSGRDSEAVVLLGSAHCQDVDDVEVLTALLRSEAATAGSPVALARYDAYRRDLADRLGVDPDPALQRLHRELLAADDPVRSGVHYDADDLLGREGDLTRLRTLVRTGRLTSIIGPGGLGKTRIAHVLAREATEPRVHFVELVGIGSPADVVSEVGSVLGVRNSVTARRALTPGQLADIRGRIAQELDSAPTLLVLDNCEHVLDAVASLVAFLLATTRDLRVVTTSRAPLSIAAERVLMLTQLAPADGAELFCRRARSARPDADLPDDVVADVVGRLDGLPLAVELAAARVRSMSVEDVRRRLDDRFALLRSRDRTAPARHQTLTAVIGWSWDLLSTDERHALSWLSIFHDGFSGEVAEAMLGDGAGDLVEGLVDQSLLVVSEFDGVLRYRMLETVREFGAQRLAESGGAERARATQSAWAVGLADQEGPGVFVLRQLEAVDALWREENNLADVLRRALAEDDARVAVHLLTALGALWTVTGNHARVFAFADLAEQLLLSWDPPPESVDVTRDAISMLLTYVGFMRSDDTDDLTVALARLGPPSSPWARCVYAMYVDAQGPGDRVRAVLAMTDSEDRATALMGWQWAAVLAENLGEIDDAATYLRAALSALDEGTTPWQVATLHMQEAMMALQRGEHRAAAEHARVAMPLLARLRADDDALHVSMVMALAAVAEGDLEAAARLIETVDQEAQIAAFGGGAMLMAARAELALAQGDWATGLSVYDEGVRAMRAISFAGVPLSGIEPWVLVSLSTALAGHVRFGTTPEQARRGADLAADVVGHLRSLLDSSTAFVDYPVTGMGLAALGAFLLARGHDSETGVQLLALAKRFGYNHAYPVMAWGPLADLAEQAAPGRLESVVTAYGDRRGQDLLAETAAVVDRVDLTSCG